MIVIFCHYWITIFIGRRGGTIGIGIKTVSTEEKQSKIKRIFSERKLLTDCRHHPENLLQMDYCQSSIV